MERGEPGAVGRLLRRYREERGLTQEELAERAGAGLSVGTIGNVERGRTRPYRHTLDALAAALDLAPAERAALLAAWAVHPGAGPAAAASPPGAWVLPLPPTPLVGREREAAAVAGLLRAPNARLLTLTGPGGVGKTRLALQAAADLGADFPDGVAFVPLAGLGQPDLVGPAVAHGLGLREHGRQPLGEALADHLGPKRLLVVLDNCEHVAAAAAALVAALLEGCSGPRVLATSRAPLRLRGEHRFPVPPLALPPAEGLTAADLARSPATALFVARARAVKPAFAPTDADAAAIAAICRRLDGLPLAIELAAARSTLLPPPALLARLERRLPLLTGGARDLPDRQQTLRDAVAWSHDLLSAEEQALFRRLAVFAGGCTLEAAAAVAGPAPQAGREPGPGAGEGRPPPVEVLDGVAALLDASLLEEREPAGGEPRLAMLETIREYALEQLEASGEAAALRHRHAAYYLDLAEAAEPELRGPRQGPWLDRLQAEHDNLRAALAWFGDRGLADLRLRLASALLWFWYARGYWAEGRAWLEEAVATDTGRTPARVRALYGLAGFSARAATALPDDIARARALNEESIELARQLGDRQGLAQALHAFGVLTAAQGEILAARALVERALTVAREAADPSGLAATLSTLGQLGGELGDVAAARARLSESAGICREIGDRWWLAYAVNGLGDLARASGEDRDAAPHYEEALQLFRELDVKDGQAGALHNLARVAHRQGDERRAADLFRDALRLFRELGDRRGIAECLLGLAGVAGATGQPERAAWLVGAAEGLLEAAGARVSPSSRPDHERDLAAIRALLTEEAFAAARTAGRAGAVERAVAEALGDGVR